MAIQNVYSLGGDNRATASEWIVARITAVSSTLDGTGTCVGYAHSWIEQRVCRNGISYEDASTESAEVGSPIDNPAYPITGINGAVNDIVLVRVRGINPTTGTTIYEFLPKSGDCPKVSSVQCTSGMLVVTYQLGCEATTDPEQLCPTTGPVGSILLWSKSTIPSGWLECNGTTYNTTTYPALFSVLGTNVLPDLKGRFVLSRNDPSLPLGTTGSITGGSGSPTLNNIALIYIIKAAN